jgi:hypothetical protein
MIYPELVHFREIFTSMNEHHDPGVRAKHLATWNMYTRAYPGLMRALQVRNFDPKALADINWKKAKRNFEAYYR